MAELMKVIVTIKKTKIAIVQTGNAVHTEMLAIHLVHSSVLQRRNNKSVARNKQVLHFNTREN